MKLTFTCLFLVAIMGFSFAQMDKIYSIDNSHSIIDFRASHQGFGAVRGTFENYDGTIIFDENNIENTKATLLLDVKSLSTRNEGRDGILKEKFFEADKFPTIIFQSTAVIKKGNDYTLEGELKIRNKIQKIQIPFEITTPPTLDQFKHKRIAFSGRFTVNRKDFELFYRGNDFWDSIVSDKIELDFEIGAYVYNAVETIFPIRDKHISKQVMDVWENEGYAAAKEKGKSILESEPQNWNTSISRMWRMALKLAQSNRLEEAVTFCDMTIELYKSIADPASLSNVQAYKGLFQIELGQNEKARKSFEKALEMYALNSMARELLR